MDKMDREAEDMIKKTIYEKQLYNEMVMKATMPEKKVDECHKFVKRLKELISINPLHGSILPVVGSLDCDEYRDYKRDVNSSKNVRIEEQNISKENKRGLFQICVDISYYVHYVIKPN